MIGEGGASRLVVEDTVIRDEGSIGWVGWEWDWGIEGGTGGLDRDERRGKFYGSVSREMVDAGVN